jgi:hypothetical protein
MPGKETNKDRKQLQWLGEKGGELIASKGPALINKNTGKYASSNSWLLGLAAYAHKHNDNAGITSLLPQAKVSALLGKNKVIIKPIRIRQGDHVRRNAQQQAQEIIPYLAARYDAYLPPSRARNKTGFCRWIIKQLEDTGSQTYKYASMNGYDDIIGAAKSISWWRGQIKKLQS